MIGRVTMSAARNRATTSGCSIAVRPVTNDNWEDFVRLFEIRGSPHYCWCTACRVTAARNLANSEKKSHMEALVGAGTPIGVLAYQGKEPVGWCSIAPRETYVRRPHRGQGVTNALLEGAVAYARERGAKVVEGYPFDTAGISSTHRGHSRAFRTAGFEQEGKRWTRSVRERR